MQKKYTLRHDVAKFRKEYIWVQMQLGQEKQITSCRLSGQSLMDSSNSLLHNHNKTKIKKKEKNPIRKGEPSEYSGGFSFVQEQDKRILAISDLGFRNIYGIFYIGNQYFKDIGSSDWSRSCSVGRD